jgi:hypothetical protein
MVEQNAGLVLAAIATMLQKRPSEERFEVSPAYSCSGNNHIPVHAPRKGIIPPHPSFPEQHAPYVRTRRRQAGD